MIVDPGRSCRAFCNTLPAIRQHQSSRHPTSVMYGSQLRSSLQRFSRAQAFRAGYVFVPATQLQHRCSCLRLRPWMQPLLPGTLRSSGDDVFLVAKRVVANFSANQPAGRRWKRLRARRQSPRAARDRHRFDCGEYDRRVYWNTDDRADEQSRKLICNTPPARAISSVLHPPVESAFTSRH
ncbi:hypothetical protein P3T21_003654 [Paraburkholderia sp. GAS334]